MNTMRSPRILLTRGAGTPAAPLLEALEGAGYELGGPFEGAQLESALRAERWDVVLADRSLSGELFPLLEPLESPPALVLLNAFGCISDALADLRRGAFDCLALPLSEDQLLLAVGRAVESVRLALENRCLRADLGTRFDLAGIVSRDARMQGVFDVLRSVADTRAAVLIEGESGTGKTMLARAVHVSSTRSAAPFVHVNCGAIPAGLLESELFGHVKGAFTGAVRDHVGKFEAAAGGTIFLDEIATASAELQVKLLRVIENQTFERVGDSHTLESDARVIAAANRPLAEEVAAGRFREDLYYRIHVVGVKVPPLRERPADVPLLVQEFLERFRTLHERPGLEFEPDVLALLVAHPWPGNVRQLQHTLERAVLLARGERIRIADLGLGEPPDAGSGHGLVTSPDRGQEPRAVFGDDPLGLPLGPLKQLLEGPERSFLVRALTHTLGGRKRAASLLGINRTTLFNKMKKYNLLDTDFGVRPDAAPDTSQDAA